MKKIPSVILLLFSCHLLLATSVSSHAIGQPPYFKVNGVFTDYYPVPVASSDDFKLPNDIAVGSIFLVNVPIQFEIDTTALPIPPEVVEKTKFLWEYGDGAKAEGLKNTHIYTKAGSYFMDIYADAGGGIGPQLLQSTAIDILPDKDYQLPKSVIRVNNKNTKDPLLDIIDVDFNKEISFDGSASTGGSSKISEYIWDLGDMNSKTGVNFLYKYNQNPYTVFPVLRVKTADGFIADSFVQIKDENAFSNDKGILGSLQSGTEINWKFILGGILVSLMLAGFLTWIISKFFLKK